MAGKIIIDTERCKGCGLCVTVCPRGCIIISKHSNKSGYFPAEPAGSAKVDCTGCAMCAIICPEAVIEVFREDEEVPAKSTRPSSPKSKKKGKPNLIKHGKGNW